MFVLPFVEDNERYFREVHRVLRSGGRFTLSGWTPVKDGMVLMGIVAEELTRKGFLPRYQIEWEHIQQSTRVNAKLVEQGASKDEVMRLLKKVGFSDVEPLAENPYGEHSYFIVCSK